MQGVTDYRSSLRIAEADVSTEVRQNDRRTPSVTLSPHKFVHVGSNHVCVNSLHPLEFRFHPIPIGLDVPGVNTGHGVDEVQGVVHSAVLGHCSHLLDIPISSPLVAVDDGPRPEMSLHDRQ